MYAILAVQHCKGGICIITVQNITLNDSKEETLPSFAADFPYIATCAELDKYLFPVVPWHWHPTVELFYMKSGTLEYKTPGGTWVFPAGSGGYVNVNVLHSSRIVSSNGETVQLLHLFSPDFLSDGYGKRIDSTFIRPFCNSGIEMIPLSPENPKEADILNKIEKAFQLSENELGYELLLRQSLSEIWLSLFALVQKELLTQRRHNESDAAIKTMLSYIHSNFCEEIKVDDIAASAHISKRACFRLFREHLQTSPLEYLTEYRLRRACVMLQETSRLVTEIAFDCGFGSGNYLSTLFRSHFSCTPTQYRKDWHDRDINKQ